jgi:hypothetical protein
LLLVKSLPLFSANFGGLVPEGVRVFEWSAGSLNNGGETLQLDRPGPTNSLGAVQYVRVDRVNYDDDAPWPLAADGKGSALAKVAEGEYGNDFVNWTAAAPTPGAPGIATDSDLDGMPDAYELAHGLDPRNPSDAGSDADGDGQSNLAEYRSGTDPRDGEDRLQVRLSLSGGSPAVGFAAVAGRSYSVQFKNSLSEPDWATLAQVPARTESGWMEVGDAVAPNGARFYRIVTPQRP